MNSQEGLQIFPGICLAERYEIVCVLGRGPTSVVYLARDRKTGRPVALKVIARDVLMKAGALNIIMLGASVAGEMNHAHIVRFHDLQTWNDLVFITMEYVPCGSLAHLMTEGGVRQAEKAELPMLRQTAAALDYAHHSEQSVSHLALSPANILFGKDNRVKIADFGIARRLHDLMLRVPNRETTNMLRYRAPEQIMNRESGSWTDIYALAAITYELLSGKPPFLGFDMRNRILSEPAAPIPDMPTSVNNALLAGLAKDPSRRPIHAKDFISMLTGEKPVPRSVSVLTVPAESASVSNGEFDSSTPEKSFLSPGKKRKTITGTTVTAVMGTVLLGVIIGAGGFLNRQPEVETVGTVFERKAMPAVSPAVGKTDPSGDGGFPTLLEEKARPSKPPAAEDSPFSLGDEPRRIQITDDKDLPSIPELSVSSIPSGAEVYLDGQFQGMTPLVFHPKGDGRCRLTIEQAGYVAWEKQVRVAPGGLIRLSAVLEPEVGSLFITSLPDGADIFISGKPRGRTPLRMENMACGQYEIVLKKPCYAPGRKSVLLTPGALIEVPISLQASCGKLIIESEPSGATWYLNGAEMGKTPGESGYVEEGEYSIGYRKEAYRAFITDAVVNAGQESVVTAKLSKNPPEKGDIWKDPFTRMEFVWVEMECPPKVVNGSGRLPQDDGGGGLWVARSETTQGQWVGVMKTNPSFFHRGNDYPVDCVSWNDVREFIDKLNNMSHGNSVYRLPTEAEWEYLCRLPSGSRMDPAGTDNLDEMTWHKDNSRRTTHPVMHRRSNSAGLFDMNGNVHEWVADAYRDNPDQGNVVDLLSGSEAEKRVYKGGSWRKSLRDCGYADRTLVSPENRSDDLGFRLVREHSNGSSSGISGCGF